MEYNIFQGGDAGPPTPRGPPLKGVPSGSEAEGSAVATVPAAYEFTHVE